MNNYRKAVRLLSVALDVMDESQSQSDLERTFNKAKHLVSKRDMTFQQEYNLMGCLDHSFRRNSMRLLSSEV